MYKMKNIKLDGLIRHDEVAHVSGNKIYAVRVPDINHGCSERGAITVNVNNKPDKYRFVGFIENEPVLIDAWKK